MEGFKDDTALAVTMLLPRLGRCIVCVVNCQCKDKLQSKVTTLADRGQGSSSLRDACQRTREDTSHPSDELSAIAAARSAGMKAWLGMRGINCSVRSRSAFTITETELSDIAKAATIGLSNMPNVG